MKDYFSFEHSQKDDPVDVKVIIYRLGHAEYDWFDRSMSKLLKEYDNSHLRTDNYVVGIINSHEIHFIANGPVTSIRLFDQPKPSLISKLFTMFGI